MTERYQSLALVSYLASVPPGHPSLAVALIALAEGRTDNPRDLYRSIIRVDIDRAMSAIPSIDG